MAAIYNRKAPKQAANLSINSDLLNAARKSGVNLSAVLEAALVEKVAAVRREKWVLENADAIEKYNALVVEHGVFPTRQGPTEGAVFSRRNRSPHTQPVSVPRRRAV
jgi:antitoxin CcdA